MIEWRWRSAGDTRPAIAVLTHAKVVWSPAIDSVLLTLVAYSQSTDTVPDAMHSGVSIKIGKINILVMPCW